MLCFPSFARLFRGYGLIGVAFGAKGSRNRSCLRMGSSIGFAWVDHCKFCGGFVVGGFSTLLMPCAPDGCGGGTVCADRGGFTAVSSPRWVHRGGFTAAVSLRPPRFCRYASFPPLSAVRPLPCFWHFWHCSLRRSARSGGYRAHLPYRRRANDHNKTIIPGHASLCPRETEETPHADPAEHRGYPPH